MQQGPGTGMFECESHAALATVSVLHQRIESPGWQRKSTQLRGPALRVAVLGMLDLDDIGAPVGKNRAGCGNEGELRHLEYPYPFHWPKRHVFSYPRSSRRCASARLFPARLRTTVVSSISYSGNLRKSSSKATRISILAIAL